MKRYLVAFLFVVVVTTGFQSDPTIQIDGVMGKDEWQGAEKWLSGDGYKLLIKKDKETLYGVMTGDNKFWAHLYLSDNLFVKVMHVSAALGSVEYKRENKLWHTTDTFNYQVRDKVYNSNTEAAMLIYYAAHGWVANNNNLGSSKTIEFKVNIKEWKGPLYFACVMADHDKKLHRFPATLNDNTVLPRLVQGHAPDPLSFDPAKWKRIK
jgi:hypothetical protein